MSFLSSLRDKNVIRQAYTGQRVRQEGADSRVHLAMLRRIGREASEEGLSLEQAYERYAEYMETLDVDAMADEELAGEDPGVVDDFTEEGEDPGNFDDDD
ncbi:MAG: hypothetical protein AAF333_07480 [Planctomycetota bacterium]